MNLLPVVSADIIVSLRKGDEKSFRIVYDAYHVRLYNFSYRFIKDKEKCQEAVQETFLRLWETRGQLDEQYPIGAYLFTITRRLTLNILRKNINHEAACREMINRMQELHNETEEAIIGADLQKVVNETINHLPRQQQLVFNLSRNEGLTHQEIAERLQLSKNTVRNHMVEALKNLRVQFNKSDIVYAVLLSADIFLKK